MRLTRGRLLLLIVIAFVLIVALLRMAAQPDVREGSVLVIDLDGEYVEGAETPWVERLLGARQNTLLSLLQSLALAERDDRLAAVVFRIRPLAVGWAKAQEIRDAIGRLREAGRRTIAYFEVERLGANLEYYVATAADEIYVAPATTAPLVGLAAEYYFLGGLWEKVGIDVEVEQAGEFKSATEFFAAKKMSDASRSVENALLDSIDAQFVDGIAEGRGIAASAVRSLIDEAPADAEVLVDAGLVDGIAYYDELLEDLGDPHLVPGPAYRQIDPSSVGIRPTARFALIYGSGPVVVGEGDRSLSGDPVIASDTIAGALEEAAADPDIRAIILRVDSPGGSPLASDVIWRATQRARAGGTPIVASLSDVAASGGYYLACGADAIVAEPGSLTGSIGAFVLRPVFGGLYDKVGIGFEVLTRAARADLLATSQPLSPAARQLLADEVQGIYALFLERVAQGRALELARAHEVARGRVWTGSQALEQGLVDELGGLRAAIGRGKALAGVDPEADVQLILYPAPRSFAERVAEALQGRVATLARRSALPVPAVLRELERWLAAAPPLTPVLLPPFVAEIR
ncbi:MAG: S49 family peptidase [Deltaproteobacteria bacterium]|nr:MAG: S49 family peptidase [Deltaproteobacteria bacterium]